MTSATLSALAVCAVAALLEGVMAGRNVRARFAALRLPRYSPPLWLWGVIGGLYYAACFIVLYRLFRLDARDSLWRLALVLALVMLAINAAWNLLFFRLGSLRASVVALVPYSIVVLGLALSLAALDPLAAWSMVPYMVYLGYANPWVYRLWKLNS